MAIIETILGAISKYSWRLFVGAFAAAGVLLFFGGRVGLSAWSGANRLLLVAAFVFAGFVSFSYLVTYLFELYGTKEKKGKIHFVPDAYNNGWGKQTKTIMDVRIGGTFTFRGSGDVRIMKAYLKGTAPLDDLMVTVFRIDRDVSLQSLLLENNEPRKVLIYMRLTPVIGEEGQDLSATLVMRDNINRVYRIKNVMLSALASRVHQ